uniref:ArfGAP with FG repeats 1b n=1 Tax=Cyprinus carpio carpio TaxID=630221 RepID=A0A8C1FEN0_CYPCA
MAASAKRKQEEKHLKMLREMTSLPPNRKCFDCDQRGPTYANMTVGSFVCTTCSGILRGLNPPHRVKSISMTTFTQQEIEFLQKHSNEGCKHIWLGLYDDKSSVIPDFREPQKVKEFLQEKYEKKRWYVPPEQAKVIASVQASISGSSASSTSSTPEVLPQPLKTLHLTKTPANQSPVTSRVQAQSAGQEKKFDLLSDLGGDIFAAPQAQTSSSSNFANFAHFNRPSAQNNSTTDFANFDSFGNASVPSHFGTSPPSKPSLQQPHTGTTPCPIHCVLCSRLFPFPFMAFIHRMTSINSSIMSMFFISELKFILDHFCHSGGGMSIPPLPSMAPAPPQSSLSTEDRYAALAELDSALSSTATSGSVQGVFGGVPGAAAPPTQPGLPNMQQGFAAAPSTNPFVAAGMVQEPMSTNPFQTNGRAAASGGFPAYGQAKPMGNYGQAVTGPGISSNPFMVSKPVARM